MRHAVWVDRLGIAAAAGRRHRGRGVDGADRHALAGSPPAGGHVNIPARIGPEPGVGYSLPRDLQRQYVRRRGTQDAKASGVAAIALVLSGISHRLRHRPPDMEHRRVAHPSSSAIPCRTERKRDRRARSTRQGSWWTSPAWIAASCHLSGANTLNYHGARLLRRLDDGDVHRLTQRDVGPGVHKGETHESTAR